MLALALSAALVLQVTVRTEQRPADSTGRDSVRHVSVGVRIGGDRRGPPRRVAVTERHLATAFDDAGARELLLTARAARLRQDSALTSYDAKAYQRVSAGMALTAAGRERLIYRSESASRVRWSRSVGAWVEMTGARAVIPIAPEDQEEEQRDAENDAVIPYFPGQEELWTGSGGFARAEVDERQLVHPLATGAEAYYTYASGDSARMRLPDGSVVRIRELRIRPRELRWNVVVGSLWFDADRGQLVRAAYRFARPLDVWADMKDIDEEASKEMKDDVPVWVKPMISPMRGQIEAVAIEYGLYGGGRFWLPRLRYTEGRAQAGFMRIPFRVEQSFRYAAVNGRDSLPSIVVSGRISPPDSLSQKERERWRDSVRAARRAVRDSLEPGTPVPTDVSRAVCDSAPGGSYVQTNERFDGQLRIAVRIPCDRRALTASADLPPSIYDAGEELFGTKEREELVQQALGMGVQPHWSPRPPTVSWGLPFTRYNRVEGLSTGAMVEQEFGAGYSARVVGRLGIADLEPNVEVSGARSDLRRTLRLGVYNRLAVVDDWGTPLGFGAGVSAFLFGRDEGFYYRQSGVEATWTRAGLNGGTRLVWRLFGEQQRRAARETGFSIGGDLPDSNVTAVRGLFAGSSLRATRDFGLDPRGWRLFSDLRLEGGGGDTISYGRAALDLTLSRGLGRMAGALTLAGGSSLGELPAQRRWHLGGTYTVRGQSIGTASGDAFWLARGELATSISVARPVLFADLGWAGDRRRMDLVGRPLSGVGAGASFMDGLVRFDVARGIWPRKQWRVDAYLEGRF
jgi:hypothetical protein